MILESLYLTKSLYFFALLILTTGLFMMLSSDNYVRKIIGLSVMQSSVLIFYLMLGKASGGVVPIAHNLGYPYSSPLPQVLMLTAIVVGFATLSVGLALIYLIFKQFGTISESKIHFNEIEDE